MTVSNGRPVAPRHPFHRPHQTGAAITSNRNKWSTALTAIVVGLALLVIVVGALAWHEEIDPVSTPARGSFDTNTVRRGEKLAAVGNCIGCHTVAGGTPFAGGTPVVTPFGTVYGANITPDAQTGIGAWSEAAFARALRDGVSRDGKLLYPAFPYDHFTHLADADIAALYAFAMTRDAVASRPPANHMVFPLNFRPVVAGWNLLFLNRGPRQPDAAQPAEWNRGAYLADALGHCAACHTPRDVLGAEKRGEHFAGGVAEGWHATALNAASPSPVRWTAEALASYLSTGLVADHALAAGPMQDVVHTLSHASEADVHAIATYVQSTMSPATPAQLEREAASRRRAADASWAVAPPRANVGPDGTAQMQLGARVYAESCASCHDLGRQMSSGSGLQLPLAVALYLPDPSNLIHIVREGIRPPDGQAGRFMPAFEGILTDEQITALTVWLRSQASDASAWTDVAEAVQKTRSPAP